MLLLTMSTDDLITMWVFIICTPLCVIAGIIQIWIAENKEAVEIGWGTILIGFTPLVILIPIFLFIASGYLLIIYLPTYLISKIKKINNG